MVFAGRKFYRYPHLRRDATAISASFAVCIVLIATEGYVATKYRQTVQLDQEGEQKAKKGGSVIFRRLNKYIGSHGAIAGLGKVNFYIPFKVIKTFDSEHIHTRDYWLLELFELEQTLGWTSGLCHFRRISGS